MKRSRLNDNAMQSALEETPRIKKRTKANQACETCRKSKTRCEVLVSDDSSGPVRCHRCHVLGNPCSYEQLESPPNRVSQLRSSNYPSTSVLPNRPSVSDRVPDEDLHDSGIDRHVRQPSGSTSLGFIFRPNKYIPVKRLEAAGDRLRPKALAFDIISLPLLSRLNWANAPISAVQEAVNAINGSKPKHPDVYPRPELDSVPVLPDSSLEDILSQEQIRSLLRVFDLHYLPWLSLPPTPAPNYGAGVQTPFLDHVKCFIASRHLDKQARLAISPRLQKLTENCVARRLFSPNPSIESVLALLILSLWAPNGRVQGNDGSDNSQMTDGGMLAASAITMAMNIGMNRAAETVEKLRQEQKKDVLAENKLVLLDDALTKAHLWVALANAESMLCIGSGRDPLIRRRPSEEELIDINASDTSDSENLLRLGLLSQIFATVEKKRTALEVEDDAKVIEWITDANKTLAQLNRLQRFVQALPVVSERYAGQFRVVKIIFHLSRILTCYNNIKDISHVAARASSGVPDDERLKSFLRPPDHSGMNHIATWSLDMLMNAEAILIEVITFYQFGYRDMHQQHTLLSTAPDRVFSVITFAAMLIIVCKFWAADNVNFELMGGSDGLLSRVTTVLEDIALDEDHSPAQCARLIKRATNAWQQRVERGFDRRKDIPFGHSEVDARTGLPSPAQTSTSTPPCPDPPIYAPQDAALQIPLYDYSSMPQGATLDPAQDIFMDEDFWASFMFNIQSMTTPMTLE